MNVIQTNAGALQLLTDALSASPNLVVRLYDNVIAAFNDATILSDLNEASFSGYMAVAPPWSAPALSGSVAQTLSGSVDFVYVGASSTVVYGFYLTNAAGTEFYGGNAFPAPVTLDTTTTTLSLSITYTQESKY